MLDDELVNTGVVENSVVSRLVEVVGSGVDVWVVVVRILVVLKVIIFAVVEGRDENVVVDVVRGVVGIVSCVVMPVVLPPIPDLDETALKISEIGTFISI